MSNKKTKKNIKSRFSIKKLTKDEVGKLLEEGRRIIEPLVNAHLPGEYTLSLNTRGEKTKDLCSACKSPIEIVYQYKTSDVIGTKGRWETSHRRCSSCKLLYDF